MLQGLDEWMPRSEHAYTAEDHVSVANAMEHDASLVYEVSRRLRRTSCLEKPRETLSILFYFIKPLFASEVASYTQVEGVRRRGGSCDRQLRS